MYGNEVLSTGDFVGDWHEVSSLTLDKNIELDYVLYYTQSEKYYTSILQAIM